MKLTTLKASTQISGYSAICINPMCGKMGRRHPLDERPMQSPECECGAEMRVFGPLREAAGAKKSA